MSAGQYAVRYAVVFSMYLFFPHSVKRSAVPYAHKLSYTFPRVIFFCAQDCMQFGMQFNKVVFFFSWFCSRFGDWAEQSGARLVKWPYQFLILVQAAAARSAAVHAPWTDGAAGRGDMEEATHSCQTRC